MEEKLYKVGNSKLNETEARKEVDSTLELLLNTCNTMLQLTHSKDIDNIKLQGENQGFKSILSQMYIENLNNSWDKEIAKEKKRNIEACEKNDFESILKDVFKSLDSSTKTIELSQSLLHQAVNSMNSDAKFSAELIKFVDKMYTDSKEIFVAQQNYNQKYLSQELEAE